MIRHAILAGCYGVEHISDPFCYTISYDILPKRRILSLLVAKAAHRFRESSVEQQMSGADANPRVSGHQRGSAPQLWGLAPWT